MNKRLDIVCHAFPSWRGDYMKSTVQLMKELAATNNVLYVDYAYSIKDVLVNTRHNKYIPVKRILGLDAAIEKVQLENGAFIHVLSLPPVIPFNWINNNSLLNLVQGINQKIINGRIKSAMKKLNMNSPIVVNAFNPFFNSVKQSGFKQKATIYYCYDNIAASNWASKHGQRLENDFAKQADALIFSSEALQQSKSIAGKISFVVTNGVDLSIFENEMEKGFSKNNSDEINIGYVGSVDDRLDYDLLEQTISNFPTWKFHFIGRIMSASADRLNKYSNVKLYGAVDVNQLPAMMKNFNAGIIPFKKDEFTKNIYPMKANEYLALGLPVVMTNFAQLNDLANFVSAVDAKDFIQSLTLEIKNDTFEKKQQRVKIAISNSWKNKAVAFEKILHQYA